MCSKQKQKVDQRYKKGHARRALQGHSSTGISRPRTKVRRTRAYFSAANTLLRSRASRGHLNLLVRTVIWFCSGFVAHFHKVRRSLFHRRKIEFAGARGSFLRALFFVVQIQYNIIYSVQYCLVDPTRPLELKEKDRDGARMAY